MPDGLDHPESCPPPLPEPPPALTPTLAPAAPPAEPLPPGPRFCGGCGTAWDPAWTACPLCTRTAQAATTAALARSAGAGLLSPILLYLAFLGSSIVGLLIGLNGGEGAAVTLAIEAVDALLVLGWCAYEWRTVGPLLSRSGGRWNLAAAGMGGLTFLLASLVVGALTHVFEVPEVDVEVIREFEAAGLGVGWLLLAICVQPALIEELAFRGVILSGTQRILNAREAVAVSALLFMVIHLAVLSFPHLLVLGLVLGWLRLRSGSLYPGMVLHFVHNLLVLGWALAKG